MRSRAWVPVRKMRPDVAVRFSSRRYWVSRVGTGMGSSIVTAHDRDHALCFYCYRSDKHTSELQSLMRHSYAVFCLTKNTQITLHLRIRPGQRQAECLTQ